MPSASSVVFRERAGSRAIYVDHNDRLEDRFESIGAIYSDRNRFWYRFFGVREGN